MGIALFPPLSNLYTAKYLDGSKYRVLLRSAELLISLNLTISSLYIRVFTIHAMGCSSQEQPGNVVQVK